jgi:hypothetical protein
MEEEHRDPDQSPREVAAESSSSKRASEVAEDMFDLGGGSRSTSLTKRKC